MSDTPEPTPEPTTDPDPSPMPETVEGLWQFFAERLGDLSPNMKSLVQYAFEAGVCAATQLVKKNLLYRPIGPALSNIRKLCEESEAIILKRHAEEPPSPDAGG